MKILILFFLLGLATARQIRIYNKCPFPTWPGIHEPGDPEGGGFRLNSGESRTIWVSDTWKAARIWPRTWCNDQMRCWTGSCGRHEKCGRATGKPPATLAEFTLIGGGKDFYDVSLVDGYNIPVLIRPEGGHGSCRIAGGCIRDVNEQCPNDLAVRKGDGRVVGCKSRSFAYGRPEDCCTRGYGPKNCKPSETSRMFKESCPTAYSYAYDDATSTFTCSGANYLVQFC